MRLSGVRRVALAAGLATAAAVALTGCSAGQVAETALKKPSNSGVNADTADSTVAIRNLQVVYNGPAGYRSGENAPVEVAIYNRTKQQIVVTISSTPPAVQGGQVISARQVGLTGGAAAATPSVSVAPEPSGSRPPATPDTETPDNIPSPDASESAAVPPPAPSVAPAPLQPARLTIEAMGSASFLPGDQEMLTLVGLSDRLVPGMSVNLVFEFSTNAAPLTLQAPVGVPLSPAPRGSAVEGEDHEPEGGEG
jgi:hypothetical protein